MARPTPRPRTLEIQASPAEIRRSSLWLQQCAAELAIPPQVLHRLDLSLNEALANLIDHGGAEVNTTPVHLELSVAPREDQREASLLISDGGRSFDPRSHGRGAAPRCIAEAEPGGLGLLMIRAFTDELRYRHRDGRNELTMLINWKIEEKKSHDGGGEPGADSSRFPSGTTLSPSPHS